MLRRFEIYFHWQIGLMVSAGRGFRGHYVCLEIPFLTLIFRLGKTN